MTAPIVEEMTTEDGNQLYAVRPLEPEGAGVIWLHWFDESPTANRGQFLADAEALARRGVTLVLPQLTFPWHVSPHDLEHDLARIEGESRWLLDALGILADAEGVDPARIAMVGHDFGAMHGMALFPLVELAGAVLVAPTPRWSDWFLRFWPISGDRYEYMRGLSSVDPITTVAAARFPLLFQFGRTDFYIAAMTGTELANSAPEPKESLSYDSGHEMELDEIKDDRMRFLVERLGLNGVR
jgi:dienelactone hydrolase